MVIYPIFPTLHGITTAFGATLGQQQIRNLLPCLNAPALDGPGAVVIFDLTDIEAVNSSYVQATALWLAQSAQLANGADNEAEQHISDKFHAVPLNIFPFVTGLSEDVAQDINYVFTFYELPCLEALTWNEEAVLTARVHGKLEGMLRHTLQIVTGETFVTASSLHEKYPGEKINITGWNNRLADLHRLRLLRRTRQGKQWLYSSVVKERILG